MRSTTLSFDTGGGKGEELGAVQCPLFSERTSAEQGAEGILEMTPTEDGGKALALQPNILVSLPNTKTRALQI